MLAAWRIWSHEMTVPFKLQWASWDGGQLATTISYIHQPQQNTAILINAIHGNIGEKPTDFLFDSGAVISVIYCKLLPDNVNVTDTTILAISANGAPLDITGQAILSVTLGALTVTQEFTVVCHLTVDYLLGADFLKKHKAIVDCGSSVLHLTSREAQYTIPITLGKHSLHKPTTTSSDLTVLE